MANQASSFKSVAASLERLFLRYKTQLQQQDRWLASVKSALPEALAKEVYCCIVTKRTLLVYTDKAMVASSLRFYSGMIFNAVSLQLPDIDAVKIRIFNKPLQLKYERRPAIPPQEAIDDLRAIAAEESGELGAALHRLSTSLAQYRIRASAETADTTDQWPLV